MKYRAVMEIPGVCYTQWTEVSPGGMKVNITGFESHIGVLHLLLTQAAASAPRVYKTSKRENSEKHPETSNILGPNHGVEQKGKEMAP